MPDQPLTPRERAEQLMRDIFNLGYEREGIPLTDEEWEAVKSDEFDKERTELVLDTTAQAISAAVLEEREACAKVAERAASEKRSQVKTERASDMKLSCALMEGQANSIADHIRSRTPQQTGGEER